MTSNTIVVVGTLDTRGDEVQYLKTEFEKKDHQALVIDVGVMGQPMCAADYAKEQVAEKGGKTLAQLVAAANKGADRKDATDVMINGAKAILADLNAEERLGAVICLGGSTGAAIGSAIMADLPVGIPKLVITTFISSVSASAKDLLVMQSPVDLIGLNTIVKQTLSNAVGAVTGMLEAEASITEVKPLVGITALGVTTPAVQKIIEHLAEKGFDTVVFHAITEELNRQIDDGTINAVIDLTPYETVPYTLYPEEMFAMTGGGAEDGDFRLSATSRKEIPMVVATGGLDLHIIPGAKNIDDAPELLKDRAWTNHGPDIVLVRPSVEESLLIGEGFAKQLNASKGQVEILIPQKGFSEVGKADAPLHDPEADLAVITALKKEASELSIKEYDYYINDDEFVDVVVDAFLTLYGPIEPVAIEQSREEENAATPTSSKKVLTSDSKFINDSIAEWNELGKSNDISKSIKIFVKGEGIMLMDKDGAHVSDKNEPADVVLRTTVKTLEGIRNGKINTHMAFLTGKVKVSGDIAYAAKLGSILL